MEMKIAAAWRLRGICMMVGLATLELFQPISLYPGLYICISYMIYRYRLEGVIRQKVLGDRDAGVLRRCARLVSTAACLHLHDFEAVGASDSLCCRMMASVHIGPYVYVFR